MPTPAAHINEVNTNNAIVWRMGRNYTNTGSTGSNMYAFAKDESPFFHSKQIGPNNPYQGTVSNVSISNSDKKFILFKNSFKSQFDSLLAFFSELDFEEANEKLSSSLSSLLDTNPDAISMELTHEQSIFYTVKKDDYTFFLQHFLNEIDEDADEAILTVFKGNDKLPSYAGSLSQTISEIDSLLEPANTLKFHLKLHELSI